MIIIFIRSLRESIRRIVLVVSDSKEILLLIIAYNLFFGWIGTILFRGTQEGEQYFPNLTEGCWNLLILLTTANFPDIMLPAYHINKAYCAFFILYLVIGLFFMLNLILATYYSNYKNRVEKSINDFIEQRQAHLRKKFKIYDIRKKGYLYMGQLRLLLKDILGIEEENNETMVHLDKIVKIFDDKCYGKVSVDDFIEYFDLVDVLKIYSQEVPYKKTGSSHFIHK